MIQFPKIQARFDAALKIIEEASSNVGGSEDAVKLAADLAAAEKTANTAGDVAKAAQDELAATKAELKTAQDQAAAAAADLAKAQEQVAALEKDIETKVGGSEAQRAAMIKQIDALDKARAASQEELDQARKHNQQLKVLNDKLRVANEANVGDPDLINEALETELEQIKEQRDADLAEVNGILARLTPLVEGA
jgi:chromosome segregation ATPase